MAKTFFMDWPLWAKMFFVLGTAIALTIGAAVMKLKWIDWKLRRYTAIDKAQKSHLQEMRRSRDIIQLRGEYVPFGVRALQSGIEIDGVWVSRPNTPAASISSFASISPWLDQRPCSQSAPSPLNPINIVPRPSHLSVPNSPHSYDTHPAMRTSVARSKLVGGAEGQMAGPSRVSLYDPPVDDLDKQNHNGCHPHMDTLAQLEGRNNQPIQTQHLANRHPSGRLDRSRRDLTSASGPSSSSSAASIANHNFQLVSTRESISSDIGREFYIDRGAESLNRSSSEASFESARARVQARPSTHPGHPPETPHDRGSEIGASIEGRDTELKSFQARLMTNAAETGQLSQHSRAATSEDMSSSPDPSEYLASRRPSSMLTNDANPFKTPKGSPTDTTRSFDIPSRGSYASRASLDNAAQVGVPLLQETGLGVPLNNDPAALRSTHSNWQPTEHRTIRRVNSGFEILPAGTFHESSQKVKEETGPAVQANIPSKAIHKSTKLQKRARPKSEVQEKRSYFAESVE